MGMTYFNYDDVVCSALLATNKKLRYVSFVINEFVITQSSVESV